MRSAWPVLIVLAVAAAWFAGCTPARGPSVRPEDVAMKARVIPSDVGACDPDVTWIVEVELSHLRPGPLEVGERDYMHEINVFDGQGPLQPMDTGHGCNTGASAGSQVSFGNDGRTYTPAVLAAIKAGDLPADYPVNRSSASGFTYLGTEFPVKVRYYLKQDPPPEKIAVVYAHYEKRLGQDHSWTKIIYADQPAVTVAAAPACKAPAGWTAVQSPMRPGSFDPLDAAAVLVHGTDGRIWQYSLAGGKPKPISRQPFSAFSPSPDGRRIAARQAESPEVWLLDRATGEEQRTGLQADLIGDWRPEGDSFFFVSTQGAVGEYTLTTGTTRWWAEPGSIAPEYRSERTLVEIAALPVRPTSAGRLSADGTQLLFAGGGSNIATLFRVDLDTGRIYAYPGTETDGYAPFWHPEGGRALFGQPAIRVLDLGMGKVTELEDEYDVHYLVDVRPDGRLLAVTGEDCWAIGPLPPTVPAALVPVYPLVPRYPSATTHNCVAAGRCFFEAAGTSAWQVLSWYATELEGLGWRNVHTPLPDTLALLYARDGKYLSISARKLETKAVVWLHRRDTAEVTKEEAVAIAGATHRTAGEVKWEAEYVPEFDSESYGISHPVWVVEYTSPRSSVAIWIDGLTAEPFRIRESDDY